MTQSKKISQKSIRDDQRNRASLAMNLTEFAHSKSKGTSRAIHRYREKKKGQFNRRAALLRQYRKTMKTEGYDAGKGASRKRLTESEIETPSDPKNPARRFSSQQEHKKKSMIIKADPFAKARSVAEQRKTMAEQREKDMEERQKRIDQSKKQRKARAKMMSQRTKRGQPIMNNVIGNLLEKIKRDS
mmetsp:Transcript_3517/g.4891  ORF Transcript_3517/g.4891 Transcript_3517/m.4891 type:complete len:187 (-) Transcript_3517:158-718(-)